MLEIIREQHTVTSVFTEEQDVESTIIIIVDIWVIIADFIVGVEVDLEEELEGAEEVDIENLDIDAVEEAEELCLEEHI